MIWRALMAISSGLNMGLAQCLPVAGDRILAADMARAVPAFAELPTQLALGYAPAPGARRTYSNVELARLARRYGLADLPGADACFIRPLETLTPERVSAALRTVMPEARMEVVEVSRQPLPPGDLRFSPAGLVKGNPGSPWLWRGAVVRGGQPDFPVWARVRVRVASTRTVAAEPLAAGILIVAEQLRTEPYEGPPGEMLPSQIVGRRTRRALSAGAVIQAGDLEDPSQVLRGQKVQVEVSSGSARLLFEAQAQGSGRRGETIAVRNPASGRIFHARVEEAGRVTVLTAAARQAVMQPVMQQGEKR